MKIPHDDEDLGLPPALMPDEVRAVRRILRQNDRVRWLWATARALSMWIIAVAGAVAVFKDNLKGLFK